MKRKSELCLLPMPREISSSSKNIYLSDKKLIVLDCNEPQQLRFSATEFKNVLRTVSKLNWNIVAGKTVPQENVGLILSIVDDGTQHSQGYELSISDKAISIMGSTPVGVFYGVQTLIQIIKQCDKSLPVLKINDWPDFQDRGVMLDISRDKVPTMDTLFRLVDMLASWKINQLQLYTEHTFAYQNHPDVWADASPVTGEEVLSLDAYCNERFIELVPNQNLFGHMRRWLIHDRYRALSECPNGCNNGEPEWSDFDEPFTICPIDSGSFSLIKTMMDELLPHFKSLKMNVGCDETLELGKGRCADIVSQKGKGQVYLEFLLKIYEELKTRGHTMLVWGDIVMEHPELLSELPHDIIAMEWRYEAEDDFDEHCIKFNDAGVPFYVCPSTSSWNSIAGRADNTIRNLRNAAKSGLEHGALGYLITDWGDNGHWQPLPVSYLGLSYGASLSWCYEANELIDLDIMLNTHVFNDSKRIMGKLVYEFGNAYQFMEINLKNNSILFRILQETPREIKSRKQLTISKLEETLDQIREIATYLEKVKLNRPDGKLIKREYTWVSNMLQHACRRGIWVLNVENIKLQKELAADATALIEEYQHIWMARNRIGGLKDSVVRLEKMRKDYLT